MLVVRRVSEKKCRFTAKKISFLEYQRVKRLELTKNITERKRLGSILFLPEADELNSLTHSSVQRILNQGSLFHSINTKNINTICAESDSLSNLNDDTNDSLNDLLYGRIFNIRCLSNYDICILLSYLLTVSKYHELNFSILFKLLEHINVNFNTFSISEISHILYNITQIINENYDNSSLLDLSCNIVEKTVKSLFTKVKLDSINFISSSNVCKILYSLTDPVFLKISHKYGIELNEFIDVYENYLEDDKANSKDFSLICNSMVQLNSPNFQLLSRISDYYYTLLFNFNSTFSHMNLNNSNGFTFNIGNNFNNPNINLDKLYCLDKMDKNIDLNDILMLLDTNERFGINHKNLLNEFNYYISTYLSIFINNPAMCTIKKLNFDDKKRKRLFTLLKNDNYLKNNRLDLQKIYSEMVKLEENYPLWDEIIVRKICKYINNKRLFKLFIDSNPHFNLVSTNIDLISVNESQLKNGCEKDGGIGESDKNEIIDKFIEAIEYLPKVINFNNVWNVLKAINLSKRTDLVPMFYSYLQESSIVFECFEDPSEDLVGIFIQIIEQNTGDKYLLELDNLCKIVEIFTECDFKRDSIGIKMFINMFNILFEVYRLNEQQYENLNQCGSLIYIDEVLGKYFKDYLKVKHLEFDRIPNVHEMNIKFRFIPKLEECNSVEEMVNVLEDLEKINDKLREVVNLNRDVFKFVIYHSFMNKMCKISLESK